MREAVPDKFLIIKVKKSQMSVKTNKVKKYQISVKKIPSEMEVAPRYNY